MNADQAKYPVIGQYSLIKTIGQGEFGKVKLAIHRLLKTEVAVKLIKKDGIKSESKKAKLLREISILKSFDHPYIVKLIEVIETDRYIGMVMTLANGFLCLMIGGELFEYILKNRRLKEPKACRFFAQILSGVSYIHCLGFVHRDLKLENLLIDANGNILITDFGFANESKKGLELLQTSCGSPCYAAPELVICDGYVGESADIWSCGVILFAMICGYLPFDDNPNNPSGQDIKLLYKYILETKLKFPEFLSASVQELLSMILVPDPAYRATMKDIIWLLPSMDIFGAELERRRVEFGLKNSTSSSLTLQSEIQNAVTELSTRTSHSYVSEKVAQKKSRDSDAVVPRKSRDSERNSIAISSVSRKSRDQSAARQYMVPGSITSSSRTARPSTDTKRSRQSGAKSLAASDYYVNQLAWRIQLHSGPVDPNALTSRDPWELIQDLESLFVEKGLLVHSNGSCTEEYKLKVERLASTTYEASDEADGRGRSTEVSSGVGKRSKSKASKLTKAITGFPISIARNVMYFLEHGSNYNHGYDGKETKKERKRKDIGGVLFNVELKKIKNMPGMLVIDFKRIQGDIWQFKELYAGIVSELPI